MNVTSQPSHGTHSVVAFPVDLKVTPFDRVAGILIALLIVSGVAVLMMFTIWVTASLVFDKPPSTVGGYVYANDVPDPKGQDGKMEEPGVEDLEQLSQPEIETALIAIIDVVATQGVGFDALESDLPISPGGRQKGKPRGVGPMDDWPPDVIPPWQRWEIQFSTTDIATYAQQLDSFKIELGAVGGGSPNVEYVRELASSDPVRRSGLPQDERRLYMTWRDGAGRMTDLDRQLLDRAGVATDRRFVLQFYSAEVEAQLLALEAKAAGDKKPSEYLKTVFAVRPVGGGYEFHVVKQTFRVSP